VILSGAFYLQIIDGLVLKKKKKIIDGLLADIDTYKFRDFLILHSSFFSRHNYPHTMMVYNLTPEM
jgi:hypothetical protein